MAVGILAVDLQLSRQPVGRRGEHGRDGRELSVRRKGPIGPITPLGTLRIPFIYALFADRLLADHFPITLQGLELTGLFVVNHPARQIGDRSAPCRSPEPAWKWASGRS